MIQIRIKQNSQNRWTRCKGTMDTSNDTTAEFNLLAWFHPECVENRPVRSNFSVLSAFEMKSTLDLFCLINHSEISSNFSHACGSTTKFNVWKWPLIVLSRMLSPDEIRPVTRWVWYYTYYPECCPFYNGYNKINMTLFLHITWLRLSHVISTWLFSSQDFP